MNKLYYFGLLFLLGVTAYATIMKGADIIIAALIYSAAIILWTIGMAIILYLSNK